MKKNIVFDTNILIDNVHGFAKWVDKLLNTPDYCLIVPTIAIAEYLTAQEHETDKGKEKSKRYLATFKIQDFNYSIAEVLGKILRRKTYASSAGLADLMIASTALFLNAELATNNKKDFAQIPDLKFFNPKSLK